MAQTSAFKVTKKNKKKMEQLTHAAVVTAREKSPIRDNIEVNHIYHIWCSSVKPWQHLRNIGTPVITSLKHFLDILSGTPQPK